jgi:hypothetical protein
MYNSLSNIQKHLYSLIQQNNPEYLQQSTRQNIKEDVNTEQRARPVNYAKPEAGEKLADYEGLDKQHAEELRYKQKQRRDNAPSKEEMATNRAAKDARMDVLRKEHYTELLDRTADIKPENLDARTAAQLLMYKIESGQDIKTPEQQMRDIGMGGALKKSEKQEEREKELRGLQPVVDPGSFGEKFRDMSASEMGTISAAAAKKEADKIRGDKPISPFYRMTRNEFKSTLGRDFDESGGANTDNMRALLNHQTNLGQRLHDIDRDWHDKINFKVHTDSLPKKDTITIADMMQYWVTYHKGARKNDRDNPIRIHPETSLDVPPPLSPRERARIPLDAAGKPIDPNDPRGRSLPTAPIDTKWKTRDPFTGEEEWKMFDVNLDQPKPTKNGICPGPFCQTSNLTGKSVNSKVSRIA